MFQYHSPNGLRDLTDEQRKALAQCLNLHSRPPDLLLHTRYVLLEPDGGLSLTAEAAQDWLRLHEEGYHVDELTGAIVERRRIDFDRSALVGVQDDWGKFESIRPRPIVAVMPAPFTPEQEERIREMIAEALAAFVQSLYAAIRK